MRRLNGDHPVVHVNSYEGYPPVNLLLTLRVALRALAKNKLRAGLTVLGVVIGIAAVTAMVSLGQSASNLVQGEVESLGTNLIYMFSTSRRDEGRDQGRGTIPTMTAADSDAIAAECRGVLAASPVINAPSQVIYGNTNWNVPQLAGVGCDYLLIRDWQIRHGGFFTERDITSAAKVCVVGRTIVEKLFQTTNPLGKTIRVANIPFQIIGVLESKGADIGGNDQDNILVAP